MRKILFMRGVCFLILLCTDRRKAEAAVDNSFPLGKRSADGVSKKIRER
jgi:hypothetical protein